jgi:NADPH:quinone reductase-like Zn-dependent oxidoreductase
MFEQMNRALAAGLIRPVIERVFEFSDALSAYRLQASGGFIGKIAVRV